MSFDFNGLYENYILSVPAIFKTVTLRQIV